MTIRTNDTQMKERIFPLQAGVPYKNRNGERVVLEVRNGALHDPATGYMYSDTHGYVFSNRMEDKDIVDFHIEEGIWRMQNGYEIELRLGDNWDYPWRGYRPHTDTFAYAFSREGYYYSDCAYSEWDIVGYVARTVVNEPDGFLHTGYWRREDCRITYLTYRNGVFKDTLGNEYLPELNGRMCGESRRKGDLIAPVTEQEYNDWMKNFDTATWYDFVKDGLIALSSGELVEIPPAWQEFVQTWADLIHTQEMSEDILYDYRVVDAMRTFPNEVQFRVEQLYLRCLWQTQSKGTPLYEVCKENTVPLFRLEDGKVRVINVSCKMIAGGQYYADVPPRFHNPRYILQWHNKHYTDSPARGCTFNPLTNWQAEMEREVEGRVKNGDYTPMPDDFPNKWGTGVHISTQNANLLAYYPTFRHWQRRVPQQIKAGRYIRQYFPQYSDDEVRRYAAEIGSGELKFYSKWEDMLKAYQALDNDGIVSSCMSKDCWGLLHPLMVYDNSDVELAVLYKGDKPVARALYNKQNKHFPMVYGQWEKMEIALRNAGFIHGSLCGAKIRRLPRWLSDSKIYEANITRDNLDLDNLGQFDRDADELLLPYIDHKRELDRSHNCSTSVNVYDDHIVIQYGGRYEANNHDIACISLSNGDRCRCEHCDNRMDEDDQYWLEADEMNVCRDCFDHNAVEVYAGRYRSFYALEGTADRNYVFVERAGRWYSEPCVASDAGYCYSEEDGEWYHEDDCVYVEELEDYVHTSEIGKTIMWDEVDGEYVTTEVYNEREAERNAEAEREQQEAA